MSTGEDITVVSYGSTLRIVQSASKKLLNEGISVELIDVQSLIPLIFAKKSVKALLKQIEF